jgi:hypothetical protein
MSQARLTLDNQVFAGALRYKRRSVSYVPRPVQTRTIQDVAYGQEAACCSQKVVPVNPAKFYATADIWTSSQST